MSVRTEWRGDEVGARADRAFGRAAIGIGERMAATAKEIVHVETGTLRRSIHVSKVDELHEDDERLAGGPRVRDPDLPSRPRGVYVSGVPGTGAGVDLLQERRRSLTAADITTDHVAIVEAGSWISYACVEETGRHHYYLHPAYEIVSPTGWETLHEAFRQEGL